MAESRHNSADVPNFDTYPSSPPESGYKGLERSALEQHAAELGAAAGRIAYILRQTKGNLETLARTSIYDRLNTLAENARIRSERLGRIATTKMQEFTRATQDKAVDLRRQAHEKTVELGRQARSNYYRARLRTQQTVREHPVETAVAIGVIGFAVGVALRIRRANRAN